MYTPISIQQLNRTVLFLVAGLLFSNACQNQNTHPVLPENQQPAQLSRFQTDSFAVYQFDKAYGFYGSGYVFSPFDNTKVWLTPESQEGFELDLTSGQSAPFSERFGHDFFKKPLRSTGIHIDPYDSQVVWFLNFHEGVYRYDQKNRSSVLLNVANHRRAISCIAFDHQKVWIGTSNGLWEYDRKSGIYQEVLRSPQHWISKIIISPEGKIQVGDGFMYDPVRQCWQTNQSYEWKPVMETNRGVVNRELPYYGEPYQQVSSPGYTWLFNSLYWFVQDTSEASMRHLNPLVNKPIFGSRADHRQLYLLYSDRFIVIHQAYLLKHRGGDPTLPQRLRRLKQLSDSLKLFQPEPWAARQEKMLLLHQTFPNETDSFIFSRINYFNQVIELPNTEKDLRTWLLQPGIDTASMRQAYQNLIDQKVYDGHWRSALRLADEMKKTPLKSTYMSARRPHGLDSLRLAVKRMSAIDASDKPADEKQWLKAQEVVWACLNSGFFQGEGCGGPDLRLAQTRFEQLLKQYPQSLWADDAAFELLTLYSFMDVGCAPEKFENLQAFLKKYPNTNCRAKALVEMSAALAYCESPVSLETSLKYLQEARQLNPELFIKKQEGNYYLDMLNDLPIRLGKSYLHFEIQLEQTTVTKHAPVQIQFKLINTGKRPITLPSTMPEGIPNFRVEITPQSEYLGLYSAPLFVEQAGNIFPADPNAYQNKSLAAGATYSETWDITRLAIKNQQRIPGKYVFDLPGVYQIKAFYNDMVSAAVQLRVE